MVLLLAYCLDGTRKHAQGLLAHSYQKSSYSRGQRTKEGFCWFLSIFTQDTTESSWQYVTAISFLVVRVFYSWIKTCTNCPWSLHWELILVIDLEAMNGSGTGSTDTCHPLWGICPRYSHYRRSDVKDGSPGRTWGTCLCHQGRCRGVRGTESSACVLDICQHPTSPHLCGVWPFTWLWLCHSHSQVSGFDAGVCVLQLQEMKDFSAAIIPSNNWPASLDPHSSHFLSSPVCACSVTH